MDKSTKKTLVIGGIGAALVAGWYFFLGPGSTPAAGGSAASTGCQTSITAIQFGGGSAKAIFSGPVTSMQYAIDGVASAMQPITSLVSLSGLTPGTHQISMTPYCMINGQWVGGGSASASFNI